MDNAIQGPFFDFGKEIIGYLPNLLGGFLLLIVGWFAGWLVKRIIVQLLVAFRLERLFTRVKWRQTLSKADIRYALFGFIGNIFFFVIFLIFLYTALDAMKLSVLSNLIQNGVLFIPKLIVALIIFGIGWIIAGRVANSVYIALAKENVPNYSLVSRFARFVILLFFSAMALTEIEIAVEIVIIGFTTIIVSLAVLAIVLTIVGGKSYMNKFFKNV
jgi:Mechanosensitive ion channel, conserved TM helix